MSDEKLEQVAGQVGDLHGKVDILKVQVCGLATQADESKFEVRGLSARLDRLDPRALRCTR